MPGTWWVGWGKGRKVDSVVPSPLSLQISAKSCLICLGIRLHTSSWRRSLAGARLPQVLRLTVSLPCHVLGNTLRPSLSEGSTETAWIVCSHSPCRSGCLPEGIEGPGTAPTPQNSLCPLYLFSSSQANHADSGLSRSPAFFLASLPNISSSISLGAHTLGR